MMSDLAESMRITRALIEHLQAENELLGEQRDTHEMRANMAEDTAANLEAENERLTQALDETMRRAYAAEGAQDLALERADAARAEARREIKLLREDYKREIYEQGKQRRAALREVEQLLSAVDGLQRAAESDRLRIEQLREALREAVSWSYGEDLTPERRDEVEALLDA